MHYKATGTISSKFYPDGPEDIAKLVTIARSDLVFKALWKELVDKIEDPNMKQAGYDLIEWKLNGGIQTEAVSAICRLAGV